MSSDRRSGLFILSGQSFLDARKPDLNQLLSSRGEAFLTGAIPKLVAGRDLSCGSQAMPACACAWIGLPAPGSLPLFLYLRCSYLDAYFETGSGLAAKGHHAAGRPWSLPGA
ncbi:hypothetical protein JW921_08500 [Candidatus Fermentibacterales bacterium]|nr:hypothetical protein [Candidatus Fermentibacterales bacterium]